MTHLGQIYHVDHSYTLANSQGARDQS